ncbi:MAG: histidinol-phosphate transaminase [Lachnospiraceae bacterium]|nr:histidinol-phosphate transaminase [Lachnospiraceae bacterium]
MGDWRKNIRTVEPYVPGEQPKYEDMIKLNTNENPYPPAPGVEKVLKSMETGDFRLYPKPDARELVDALAAEYGVPAEQVFVGVGSDDVLGMAFLTCFCGDKEILFPDITYSFYPVWADLFRIPYKRPALDENFRIKKEDYFVPNGGIVIANPNAPTSIALPLADIEEIVKHNPDSVVIIDEAYVDFGGESALPLVEKYDNLLVVQTFSKSRSMAGMRIGFAIGNRELIDAMYAVRNSYNSYTMNMPSILCGVEAVKDRAYFDKTRTAIMETREDTAKKLTALGFTVLPSATNFLFAAHESVPAEELFAMLREKHIYVRYFKQPGIQNYLRITIGTPEQMERFVAEVEQYLADRI